jgi:hypothetical protein
LVFMMDVVNLSPITMSVIKDRPVRKLAST